MNKQDADRDAPAAGPGAVAKTVLRTIDACLHLLQRLRNRFEASDEVAASDDRHAQAGPAKEDKALAPALLRRALIVLLCLLAGGGGGALLVYRGLSMKLHAHSSVVEHLQEELDIAKKEEARTVKLMDRFQRENAEYRHEARDAQREAETHKRRADELDEQLTAVKQRAERPAPQSGRAATTSSAAKSRPPQKTGNCAVGGANLGGDLSTCIEKFNR
jgi:hypothetical protein